MHYKKIIATIFAMNVFACGIAQAEEESNPWMLRARMTQLNWDNKQADGLPNIDAKDVIVPTIDVTYFFTKNIAAELVLTYPQKVDIQVAGKTQGTVKALPPSLLVQYHFTDLGAFKPYIGAGLNYTVFSDRNNILGGAASIDRSSLGYAVQVGADYMFNKNWGLNFDVKYLQIKTDVAVSGKKIGNLGLSPIAASLGIAYKF